MLRLLLLVFIAGSLMGCAALTLGGAGGVALGIHDRRTFGTVIDDQSLEFQGAQLLRSMPELKEAHVNVTSYNLSLLLTGEVPNAEAGLLAEKQLTGLSGINRVYNELVVASPSSLTTRTADTLTTSKVKAALIKVNVKGFDPTRVKVVTERGIVYLMGLLTQAEAAAVVDVVREVYGVQEIVRLFEYIQE